MERMTVGTIFEFLKRKDIDIAIIGNEDTEIFGFSSLMNYRSGCITWVKNQKSADLCKIKLTAVICAPDIKIEAEVRIETKNPKDIFFTAAEYLGGLQISPKIAPTVVLGENVEIGENVSIGDYCCIGDNVQIGDGTILEPHVVIHRDVSIGKNCRIKSGAVIGGDGYGYAKRDKEYKKIYHFGRVVIGDYVDIGSNTCIDRGTIDDTVIGDGVKIDNLCHIAHNVVIGNNSCVVANSAICGSAIIGKEVYIAPCSVIRNQIKVEDGAVIGMGAGVTKDIPQDTVNMGFPARTIRVRNEEDWRIY